MTSEERPFRSLTRAERRVRIVWAAKWVMLEKGLESSSMDDVAARAGTTKPTVYAHFKSKDELFAAVVELIKGFFLGKLRSPEDYADEPVEAIALFCGRLLELASHRDVIGYHRVLLAGANQSPAVARAIHDATQGEATRSLAAYLRTRDLTPSPERYADLILSATTAGTLIRHLYGVDEPSRTLPDGEMIGTEVDLKRIRQTVGLIATSWSMELSD